VTDSTSQLSLCLLIGFFGGYFDGTLATSVYFNQIIMYDVERTWEKHL